MKKIINGKKYDTETATEICENEPIPNRTNFYWYREVLYKKKNGEFFIYGNGGPASKYCESGRNWACTGSKILPLSEQDAKYFVERFGTVEIYEALFGETEE